MRTFSAASHAQFNNGVPLSAEDAYALSTVQIDYENDNVNPKRAYEYFVELNKHHFYLSVVNEYKTYKERAFQSKNQKTREWEQRMTGQYEFALDHIKQGVKSSESYDSYARLGMSKFWVDMALMFVTFAASYSIYLYLEPFKHAESLVKHEEKMKFEIKMAKDVEQRLEDVKGITEIKDEI